jgi:hypothetical protein
MIHNLTGWGAPVKAGNSILIVARIVMGRIFRGRIFRIKRPGGERAVSAADRLGGPARSSHARSPSHVA